MISRQFDFDGKTLVDAIRATFKQRQTIIPKIAPLALTDEYAIDKQKVIQWAAFLRKNKLESVPLAFEDVIKEIRAFLLEPLQAALLGTPFRQYRKASDTWKPLKG